MISLLGGLIGGAIGVFIWAAVGYYTHYEVGWIAWGVGFLAGLGVQIGASRSNQQAHLVHGVMAVVIAVAAILIGKFLVVYLDTHDAVAQRNEVVAMFVPTDERMIASMAYDVAEEATIAGKPVAWPAGMTLDKAEKEGDFPPDVWAEGARRWKALGPKKQEERRKAFEDLAVQLKNLNVQANLAERFSFFDVLWFGLAMLTAFRVGRGGSSD